MEFHSLFLDRTAVGWLLCFSFTSPFIYFLIHLWPVWQQILLKFIFSSLSQNLKVPLPETVATELGNERCSHVKSPNILMCAYLISLLNIGKASYLTDSFIIYVFLHCPPICPQVTPFLWTYLKLWNYGIVGLLTSNEKSSEFRTFQNLLFLIILRK